MIELDLVHPRFTAASGALSPQSESPACGSFLAAPVTMCSVGYMIRLFYA